MPVTDGILLWLLLGSIRGAGIYSNVNCVLFPIQSQLGFQCVDYGFIITLFSESFPQQQINIEYIKIARGLNDVVCYLLSCSLKMSNETVARLEMQAHDLRQQVSLHVNV